MLHIGPDLLTNGQHLVYLQVSILAMKFIALNGQPLSVMGHNE
jgi:hypothetical protein